VLAGRDIIIFFFLAHMFWFSFSFHRSGSPPPSCGERPEDVMTMEEAKGATVNTVIGIASL